MHRVWTHTPTINTVCVVVISIVGTVILVVNVAVSLSSMHVKVSIDNVGTGTLG